MKNQTNTTPSPAQKAVRRFPKRLQAAVNERQLGTALASAADLPLTVAIPCPLLPDSIRYAACRAFLKSPGLRAWVLERSYRLRLGGRRRPRQQRFCMQLPAQLFALTRGQAFIAFSVSAEQVCVEQVWLLPEGTRPPRCINVRLQLPGASGAPDTLRMQFARKNYK